MNRLLAPLAALFCLAALPARADDQLVFGLGWYDFNDNKQSASAQLEWRPGVRYWDYVSPFAGAFVNSDGGVYGYGGLGLDFAWDSLYLYPNFAVGAYGEGGSKDLGSVLEFRSGLELGYRFAGGAQFGVAVHHISNASISSNNPGTEILTFNVGLPISPLFGE